MYRFYKSIFLLMILQSTKGLEENHHDCMNDPGNCSVRISKYQDLEEYIISCRDILYTLKAPIGISSDQSNDATDLDLDDVDADCTNHQTVYIWNESPLYLLGPKQLFWSTLFAINVPETSVTIELPCLCKEVYYKLLSRLTYLIKAYSIKDGIDSTDLKDFINPNYFCTEGNDDENCRKLYTIFQIAWILPIVTTILFLSLYTYFLCVHSKFSTILKNITKGKQKFQTDEDEEGKINKSIYLASLFATNVVIIITLFTFKAFSWVRYVPYGKEVVHYDEGYLIGIFSVLLILFIAILTIFLYIMQVCCMEMQHDLHKLAALLTAFSIVMLGGFFSPYMVLAFIHNPLQTSLTYLFEVICVLCLYYVFLGLSSFYYWMTTQNDDDYVAVHYFTLITCYTSISIAALVTLMAIVNIHFFAFGSFDNYQELENLILPLFIGLLSFIFFKPIINYLKSKLYDDSKESTDTNDDHNDYSNLEAGHASGNKLTPLLSNDTSTVNID